MSNYGIKTVDIPLSREDGDKRRDITIPIDLTQSEADYFAAWFKLWVSLDKSVHIPGEPTIPTPTTFIAPIQ